MRLGRLLLAGLAAPLLLAQAPPPAPVSNPPSAQPPAKAAAQTRKPALNPPEAKAAAKARMEAALANEEGERAWAGSLASGDASVPETLLADDFVGVAPDGSLYDKTQAVAEVKAGRGDYTSDRLERVTVRFFGDTAIAQGSEAWTRSDPLHPAGRFVWTDVWLRRHGRWRVVSAEDLIPPK